MLRRSRRTVGWRAGHVHGSASDETELVLLPLQRRPKDVRHTLGLSAVGSMLPSCTSVVMYLGQKMITQLRYKCDSNTDESDEDKII